MTSERQTAIEDAFNALEGVSSARFYRRGVVEGVNLAKHPAIRVWLENMTFFVFLAREMLDSAELAPDEIATHYSGAIQHYSNQRAA